MLAILVVTALALGAGPALADEGQPAQPVVTVTITIPTSGAGQADQPPAGIADDPASVVDPTSAGSTDAADPTETGSDPAGESTADETSTEDDEIDDENEAQTTGNSETTVETGSPAEPPLVGSTDGAIAGSGGIIHAANGTAVSIQTDPTNQSITVIVGTQADTQGTTQVNASTADATATAIVDEPVSAPTPVTTEAATTPASSQPTESAQSTTEQVVAAPGTTAVEQPVSNPVVSTPPTSTQQNQSGGNGRGNRGANASSSASQSRSRNRNVDVRVGAPGSNGQVNQTNSSTATATTAASGQELPESATATAAQEAPSNTNISVRVASPGDNGAVTQTNSAAATATTGDGGTAQADASQVAPVNTNVSLRLASPGTDGTVTQGNTATTASGSSPITIQTGGSNTAVSIRLGDGALGALPSAGSSWDWNWAWDWTSGADPQAAAQSLADQLASLDWDWAAQQSAAADASDVSAPAATAAPESAAGSSDAATGMWTWTWSWDWQQDNAETWTWDWSWSQPCDCSWTWDWDWEWDWRTAGDATAQAPSVISVVDPTIVDGVPADIGASAETLAPVSQLNTSAAAADAKIESHVTRLEVTLDPPADRPAAQSVQTDQLADATATTTQKTVSNTSVRAAAASPTQSAAQTGLQEIPTGAVDQSNGASSGANALATSDIFQTIFQGELLGGEVTSVPSALQDVTLAQMSTADSSAGQTIAENQAFLDLSGATPVGVWQANTASATATTENTSVVYQESEQAQAVSGTEQTIVQDATVGQAGATTTEVDQQQVSNLAIADNSGRPLVDQGDASITRDSTLLTQVNRVESDTSVASDSTLDQMAAQLSVASVGNQHSTEQASVDQIAAAASRATQWSAQNIVVPDLIPVTEPPIDTAEATDLDLTQANVSWATATGANVSYVTQASVQIQLNSTDATASATQKAKLTQATAAVTTTDQWNTVNAADDVSLGSGGALLQGMAALADATTANGSAIAQSITQTQSDLESVAAEATNDAAIDQENVASAHAAITDVLNLGPFNAGEATTIAASGPATAENLSLVEQLVEQTQEVPIEEPDPPHSGGHSGGGTGGGGSGGSGGSTGGGTSTSAPPRGSPSQGHAPSPGGGTGGGQAPGFQTLERTPTSGAQASAGADVAPTPGYGGGEGLGGDGDAASESPQPYSGLNPTETYGNPVLPLDDGSAAPTDLASSSSSTSLIALLGSSASTADASLTATPHLGEPSRPVTGDQPSDDGSDDERAGCALCASPSSAGAGGGPGPGSGGAAAEAFPISASPSDDGEVQDPPTSLEPPGAVVELLDTPG